MKKKVLVLMLATTFALSACGTKAETIDSEVAVESEEEVEEEEAEDEDVAAEEEAEEEEAEDEDVAAEEEVEEEEADTEEEAEDEEAEEAGSYVRGTVTEEGWESEWIGLRYALPEGMIMSTDEELNEIMGIGKEMLSEDFTEEQLEHAYDQVATVYEMMSTDEYGAVNVIVLAEKPVTKVSAEAYVAILTQQLSQVSAAEYEVLSSDEVVTLGDVEFIKLSCTADYSGVALYQDYYVTAIDDRIVSITMTYSEDTVETAQTMMSAFSAY